MTPTIHALNLLPDAQKKTLKRIRTIALLKELLILLSIAAILGSAVIFAARLNLESAFGRAIATPIPGFREVTLLNRKIRIANRWMDFHERFLQPSYLSWPKLFTVLGTIIPEGAIRLQAVTVSEEGMLTIVGVASTRNDLIALRAKMKEMPLFKEVILPLQSLAQERSVPFSMGATLNLKELEIHP